MTYYNNYQTKDVIKYDYSNCIIPTIKALEHEIKTYFIHKYRRFLEEHNEVLNLIPLQPKEITRLEKFTLGNFKDLIGFKQKPLEDIMDKDFFKENLNFRLNQEYKTYVIDKRMLSYLKEELFDLNKFSDDNVDEEIINYMKELCEYVDQINRDYRNPSAHENIMDIKSAETVINWLLFNKRILFRFFEKIKINN
jgi:hypothetical protein